MGAADESDPAGGRIPDWNVLCPICRYPLRGLPTNRCPECGNLFDLSEIVRPWTRRREPRAAAADRPLPDYGLACSACGESLAGAAGDECPHCRRPFSLTSYIPRGATFLVERASVAPFTIGQIESLLVEEAIPFMPLRQQGFLEAITGQWAIEASLTIPTEFFLDFRRAAVAAAAARRLSGVQREKSSRACDKCGARNPLDFEICWRCEAEIK